jgi:hypothetical protein
MEILAVAGVAIVVVGGLIWAVIAQARSAASAAADARADQSKEVANVQTEMGQAVANAPASVDALAERVRQQHDL